MAIRVNYWLAALAGVFVFALVALGSGDAKAGGGNGCSSCTTPPPSTCCQKPPTCNSCNHPTPPPPPVTPCCTAPPGHNVYVPGVNVYVAPSVIVNANVSATVNASASASASASGQGTGTGTGAGSGSGNGSGNGYGMGGGGGGGPGPFYAGPGPQGFIQGLNVEGGREFRRVAYQAERTITRRVVIQAVCLDDTNIPHPASQVTPDRDIEDGYEGELYRCIAGTRMQYVIAEFNGQIDFDRGQTIGCRKNDALVHHRGGKVECMAQLPARDCNERSLLRRFGAGVKVLTIITTETYTAYRDEQVEAAQTVVTSMSIDGGVGPMVF